MADPTSVNSQITDAITQENITSATDELIQLIAIFTQTVQVQNRLVAEKQQQYLSLLSQIGKLLSSLATIVNAVESEAIQAQLDEMRQAAEAAVAAAKKETPTIEDANPIDEAIFATISKLIIQVLNSTYSMNLIINNLAAQSLVEAQQQANTLFSAITTAGVQKVEG